MEAEEGSTSPFSGLPWGLFLRLGIFVGVPRGLGLSRIFKELGIVKNKDVILKTWLGLNTFLRAAKEKECQELLKHETCGDKRKKVMLRIHSRLNYLRAARERKELLKLVK